MSSNIEIHEGDITKAQVEAIVNAANPIMLGGGGVDGAIHAAAGPKLLEECRKIKPVNGVRCPFGEARITAAGNLAARYVIHAVGPIYRREREPAKLLTSVYEHSLNLAIEYGCQSIAFPAISCGAYGYPHVEAAEIAFEVCCRQAYGGLNIHFYLFGRQMYDLWRRVAEER